MAHGGPDIQSGRELTSSAKARGWLASGWFTPDYRPLAENLARQMHFHGVPYHLYGVNKMGSWSREVLRKPTLILRAMREHPDQVLIFMDVDCQVCGPLDEATGGSADVMCSLYVKQQRGRQRSQLSSRVIVIRPTPGARKLIESWALACQEANTIAPDQSDEAMLMVALARSNGALWTSIDPRFAGLEVTVAPKGSVIVHESAHEHSTAVGRFNRQVKSWRRFVFGSTTTNFALK